MSDETKSTCTVATGGETTDNNTVPIWLVGLFFVLLFVAGWLFDQRSGWFDARVAQPFTSVGQLMAFQPKNNEDPAVGRGKIVFEMACAACHDSSGAGKLGTAPPLAGSDWVNAPKTERLIRIPLYGLAGPITVSGKQYTFNAAMLPLGDSLSDQQIADALTYVRQAWGNKGGPVTEAEVAAVRKEVGKRPNFTEAELLKIADR